MRAVVQNDKSRASRVLRAATAPGPRGRAAAVAVLLAAAALAAGCAQDAPDVRGAPGQEPLQAPPARALDGYAAKLRAAQAARVAAAKRWNLAKVPLTAPEPPAKKPEITARDGFEVEGQEEDGLPPVFTTIPTKEKIVFLTIDDGAEKDRAFLRMMSELKIPYTVFLTDEEIKDDYGYFKKMQGRGVTLNNHTLSHPYLPGLSYAEQKREICGMQDVMEKRYGKRPVLFRPPFGNYNRDTLRAAKTCGIEYAPIWNEEVFVDHWEYREWDRDLHPGDIVLTHFRGTEDWDGTMTDMARRFLDRITAEGYAVARLEDYL
ncbi:polysaccharide deacetylase family protein [Streptomyces sp. BPPL-273]|uniref:Polysaccharide deacetylase family protein n=1 Tax=Streptomyces parvulus TaxID=146923 RepID=A0ABV5D529_9ACTN|nr:MULTISPECIES: polysaccharide deacetylase family protein [Streptomyces]MCQ4196408.1 polysaccharide deacetylase family protein [Streptomyces parvulus]WHM31259.1 polysaccharide deacetylase family protein [Streptomyces sp. BPPL-273]